MIDLRRFPRVELGHWPTPLERMDRLRAALGPTCPTLYVKRDDCTGLATGGNKTRKLEFLMGEALAQGADTVVTFGAIQSNHARQTAAAAAKLGLGCDLILIDMVARDEIAYRTSGNVLLDHLLGARVHVVDSDESAATVKEIVDDHARAGRKAYVVPIGGSNVTGSLGYVAGFGEIDAQAKLLNLKVDAIVHASSSAGTQAGLIVGASLADSATRIVGVNVYKKRGVEIATDVRNLALETAERLRQSGDDVSERVEVIDGYQGEAYGQPTDEMRHALNLAARHEGLIFDPVYSGKALAAFIGEIARGTFTREQTIVFVHTGGTAALGAYAEALKATLPPEN